MGFGRRVSAFTGQMLAETIGPAVVRLLGSTLRIRTSGLENIAEARARKGNVIFAIWHGRLLTLTYVQRHQGIVVLVSRHRDGEYIARIISRLGFGTVRGSTTRGGIGALLSLLNGTVENKDIGITPDGPHGPREHCQSGVIYLAKKTGLPVIPIGTSSRPRLILKSWDRFIVPVPFARCVVVYGEPAYYDGSLDSRSIETAQADLERRLKRVTEEADHGCGHTVT